MATPLRPENLGRLRVPVPTYDRTRVTASIVHVGVGHFHRAHQAVYLDELLDLTPEWGLCGVGLRPQDAAMRDALVPQSGLYTVVERGAEDRARVIGSMARYLFWGDDPDTVVEQMASPQTRIVSLTITEGGYPVDPETGAFVEPSGGVRRVDVPPGDAAARRLLTSAAPSSPSPSKGAFPRSAFHVLAEALRRRRARGLEPFTVMSCDNVQSNGDVARTALLGTAEAVDADLRDWITDRGAFPNSMVDRITPATTDDDRAMVSERFGINDAWPVVCEPFRQWVLEDSFAMGRPPLERVGVQIVDDVRPFETLKLRVLNGGHSALAYPGALLGMDYIHDIACEPVFRRYLRRLWEEEVLPTLEPVLGIDPSDYAETLIERFSNPATRDRTARVCMDGSSKLSKFILPTVRDRLAAGASVDLLGFVIAAWGCYLRGRGDRGRPIDIDDPLAERLREAAAEGPAGLLAVPEVFGSDLSSARPFVNAVEAGWKRLRRQGTRSALGTLLDRPVL